MVNYRRSSLVFLLILLSSSALGKIPSYVSTQGEEALNDDTLEEGSGYEFLDEEFSGSYSDFLDEYLGGSGEGEFPLEDLYDSKEGSTSYSSEEESGENVSEKEEDDFPLEDPVEEVDDIHFVDSGVKPIEYTPDSSSSTTVSPGEKDVISEEPDSTFLFANRFLFFILYGAAIMVLLLAILLVICLLIQCRKKRKDSLNLMNKTRVMGINNSLSKSSRDSIIIDCYRIHKNPLGHKV